MLVLSSVFRPQEHRCSGAIQRHDPKERSESGLGLGGAGGTADGL
jgi:hypothetical protein